MEPARTNPSNQRGPGLPEPLDRARRLGEGLASTPLRLLSNLADPIRDDIGRGVRRSFGISGAPRPPPWIPRRRSSIPAAWSG